MDEDARCWTINSASDLLLRSQNTLICARPKGLKSTLDLAHNPEVAGSNPAPLQVKLQVSGPFDQEIERAADVDVRRMYAAAAAGHRQMWADPGECVVEEPLLGGARVTSPTRSRLERRRLGGHCPRALRSQRGTWRRAMLGVCSTGRRAGCRSGCPTRSARRSSGSSVCW